MAQRKSPSYPEWPVDRSVYSLFCGSDRTILGDLGLSMEVKDSTGTLDAGLVGGTRDYWPPEKSEGHTRINLFKVRVFPFFVLRSTVSPFEMFINKHYLLQ